MFEVRLVCCSSQIRQHPGNLMSVEGPPCIHGGCIREERGGKTQVSNMKRSRTERGAETFGVESHRFNQLRQ